MKRFDEYVSLRLALCFAHAQLAQMHIIRSKLLETRPPSIAATPAAAHLDRSMSLPSSVSSASDAATDGL
jgi:hypothetical protein